jgi:hypothetical protein
MLAVMFLTGISTAAEPPQSEAPRWFVLRDGQTGYCRPALLIRIDGVYQHGASLLAGGPYQTQAQATARLQQLIDMRSCVGN